MDINTHIAQPRSSASSGTPEQAVQIKVSAETVRRNEAAQKPIPDGAQVVPVAVSAAEKKQADQTDNLGLAVSKLNDFVQNIQRDLQFSIDEKSGEMVVKVVDTHSQKVIRQIPSEDALKLARSLMEQDDDGKLTIFSSTA
jgi:flagellar protein FlaG